MSEGSAVLWNPTIRKSKKLSSLRLNNTWIEGVRSLSTYSFGYDPFIHNYKIVAISVLKDKSEVNVHTLGSTDDWRRIQDFPNFSPHGPGIFVNGTVNWLAVERLSTCDRVIVSLDLKKEMYQKLPPPDSDKESWTLGVSRDCLCIFAKSSRIGERSRFLDVWIMKEYGNKESWTKLYSVPHREQQTFSSRHREHQSLYSFKSGLYISKNDQLLMDFFELDEAGSFRKIKLVVYHSKTGTLKIADIENFSHWIEPNVYIESLISPCP
jgi:F-box interacting protein